MSKNTNNSLSGLEQDAFFPIWQQWASNG